MDRSTLFAGLSRRSATALLAIGGGLSGLLIQVGGRFSLGELFFAVLLGTILLPALLLFRYAYAIYAALAVFFAGLALVATVIRPGPLDAAVLLGLNYGLTILVAVEVCFLLKRATLPRGIPVLLAASAIGQAAGVLVTPTSTASVSPWRFGLGYAVTILALLIADRLRKRGRPGIALLVAGALAATNLVLGARSLALLVVAVLVLCLAPIRRRVLRSRGTKVMAAAFIAGVFWSALTVYDELASSGILGESALDRYSSQVGDFGILPGARKELIVLLFSWLASPIFGWGVGGTVPSDIRTRALAWFSQNGYEVNYSTYLNLFGEERTSLHSVALGALVQTGVFALPLILIATVFIARGVFAAPTFSAAYATSFVVMAGGTHLLISPLGDITRYPIALALGTAMALVLSSASQAPAQTPQTALPQRRVSVGVERI